MFVFFLTLSRDFRFQPPQGIGSTKWETFEAGIASSIGNDQLFAYMFHSGKCTYTWRFHGWILKSFFLLLYWSILCYIIINNTKKLHKTLFGIPCYPFHRHHQVCVYIHLNQKINYLRCCVFNTSHTANTPSHIHDAPTPWVAKMRAVRRSA